jgi:hypothetical protein
MELTATSWPAHNRASPARSLASPATPVTLGSLAILSGFRAIPVTWWPRPASSATMADPARPEAPAMAIFMRISPDFPERIG